MNKRKGLNMEQKRNLTGWAFLLPASILIFVFCFYPMVQALILSFQKGTGSAVQPAGFANYARILKDATFQQCLFNTIFYFVIQVPIMLILALILAQLLNSPDIKGKGIYRTMIFLPCATSLVSYSMIFKSLFANDGLVNRVLSTVGIPTVDWFQNAWAARWVIVIALIWRWTGYNMVFYLAGLQNIDYSIYEAARIDGASPIQQFIHLTIPLLKPTILLTAIMSTSGTLQLFDESVNLTAGGPGKATMTLTHYMRIVQGLIPCIIFEHISTPCRWLHTAAHSDNTLLPVLPGWCPAQVLQRGFRSHFQYLRSVLRRFRPPAAHKHTWHLQWCKQP